MPQRGPVRRLLSGGGGALTRVLRVLAVAALACATVAGLAIGALSWRLAQGPLDIGWAAPWIEGAVNTPDADARLTIGGAAIQWQAFGEGSARALDLHLRDVRFGTDAVAAAEVAGADVALSPGALLSGRLVPRHVMLDGLRLRLVRRADGSVGLDTTGPIDAGDGPGATVAETVATLARPAGTDQHPTASPALQQIGQLRTVRLTNAAVVLLDRRLGATFEATGIAVDLRRGPAGGVSGTAAAALAVGPAAAQLAVTAELAEGGTRVAATLSPVSLAALAGALPALAPAVQFDMAIEVSATAELSSAMAPRRLSVRTAAGSGSAQLPAVALAFESLALDVQADWDGAPNDRFVLPDRLAVSRGQVVLASPAGGRNTTLGLAGQAARQADRVRADLGLTVDHLAFADLPGLWPAAWGGPVRPWLTENITAGIARDGQVTLGIEAPADLSSATLVAAGGTLQGDDVTIHWLRPVPPIERAQAKLTITGPDVIEIAVSSARQGTGQLTNGLVRFSGLSAKDQVLALTTDVATPVPDLLTLLRHPRLRLLDRHPLPARNPAGTMVGKLTVTLPLVGDLDFADVGIQAGGQLSGLRLGGLVAGRDLDRGEVTIDVTQESLKASGRGTIASIPATLSVEMDFRSGIPAQVVKRASASGTATARQLAAAGLDPGGVVGAGVGSFTAVYQARRDGQGEVRIQADMRDAALAIAGWRKAPGQPATGSARLLLRSDRLQGIGEIQAQGSGMQIRGRADMVGDRPAQLVLDPIVLGPTRARGEIRIPTAPNEPLRVTLQGTVLDLSTQFTKSPGPPEPIKGAEDNGPWMADVSFDTVILADGRSVDGVTARAEHDGRRLRRLQAESGGPERFQALLKPEGSGRSLSIRAADGGALLRATGTIQTVVGGQLAVDGRYDDSGPVAILTGTADLRNFHVRDAPAVGKVLQALTVYGIGEAMSGPGLAFTQLTAPFRWNGSVVDLMDAQAFSNSLGLTVEGRIDTMRKALDLKGTIVPAYALNSALGRIPLLGRLFSAEAGGGLVAVNYTLRGSPDDPSVSVNPLSALTPGFLRGLFRIFD